MEERIHLSSQTFEIEPDSIYFLLESEYLYETHITQFDPSDNIRYVCLDGELDHLLAIATTQLCYSLPTWPFIQHFCDSMDKMLDSDSNQLSDSETHSILCIYMTKEMEQKHPSNPLLSKDGLYRPRISVEVFAIYLLCCWQIRSRKQSVQESWSTYDLYHTFRSIYSPFPYLGFSWWRDIDKDDGKAVDVDPVWGEMITKMFLESGDTRCKASTSEILSWEDVYVCLDAFARMHETYSITEVSSLLVPASNSKIMRLTATLAVANVASNDLAYIESLENSLEATFIRIENDQISTHSEMNCGKKTIHVNLSELETESKDETHKVFSSRKETKAWKMLTQFLHICEIQTDSIVLLSSLPDVPLWICGYLIKHEQLSEQQASAWLYSCTSNQLKCSRQQLYFLKRWKIHLTRAGDAFRLKVKENHLNIAAISPVNDGISSKLCKEYRRIGMGRVNLRAECLLGIRVAQHNDQMMVPSSLAVSHPVRAMLSPSTRAAQSSKHRQMINASRLDAKKVDEFDRDVITRSDYSTIRRYLNPTSK